jgi:hypothetical protein
MVRYLQSIILCKYSTYIPLHSHMYVLRRPDDYDVYDLDDWDFCGTYDGLHDFDVCGP